MKGFKKRSLTKNYELNIIESSNDMNPKDDSFLSGSKGSFSPPGENLSSGSISILNKKLRVRKDKENRRYTLTRDNSEYNNYTGILKRKSFQLNNIKTKKYANYKVTYKESITYSDSEDVIGDKKYEYPTNIVNQIFFFMDYKIISFSTKNWKIKIITFR